VLSLAQLASSSHESLSAVSSFLHLQQQHLFMTISYHTLTTWNFKVTGTSSCHCEVPCALRAPQEKRLTHALHTYLLPLLHQTKALLILLLEKLPMTLLPSCIL
jgi:hypothetical protein